MSPLMVAFWAKPVVAGSDTLTSGAIHHRVEAVNFRLGFLSSLSVL